MDNIGPYGQDTRTGFFPQETEDFFYDGQWRNGLKQGHGKLMYKTNGLKNGDAYEGDFHLDTRSGKGTMVYRFEGTYTGDWEEDRRNGKGSQEFNNGFRYTGDWKNDMFHGEGSLYQEYYNYTYTGWFVAGKKCGSGVEQMESGSYTGEFHNGMRHGKGKWVSNKVGYEYNGQWKSGYKDGYGIEYWVKREDGSAERNNTANILNDQEKQSLNDPYIYEGEFKNGYQNGNGLKIMPDNKFYYGFFIDNKLHNLVYESVPNSKEFDFYVYNNGKRQNSIQTGDNIKELRSVISGYFEKLSENLKSNYLIFEDNEFDCKDYYKLKDPNLKDDKPHIDINKIMIRTLDQINSAAVFEIPKIDADDIGNVKFDMGEIYDLQLIFFLKELLQRPRCIDKIVHLYTNHKIKLYCFWMYFDIEDVIQRYPVVIDSNLPVSEEGVGSNLFCQLEKPNNSIITYLEKAFNKYVFLNKKYRNLDENNNILTKGRFINLQMLAFQGQPCTKINCNSLGDDLTISFLKKQIDDNGTLCFAYLKKNPVFLDSRDISEIHDKKRKSSEAMSNFGNLSLKNTNEADYMGLNEIDDNLPFKIVGIFSFPEIGEDQSQSAVIVETIIPVSFGFDAYSNYEIVKLTKLTKKFEHLFNKEENKNLYSIIPLEHFINKFEVLYLCNFNENKNSTVSSFNQTTSEKTLKSNKTLDLFFKFKLSHQTKLNFNIAQDHKYNFESKAPLENLERDFINLPCRYLQARKSMVDKTSEFYKGKAERFTTEVMNKWRSSKTADNSMLHNETITNTNLLKSAKQTPRGGIDDCTPKRMVTDNLGKIPTIVKEGSVVLPNVSSLLNQKSQRFSHGETEYEISGNSTLKARSSEMNSFAQRRDMKTLDSKLNAFSFSTKLADSNIKTNKVGGDTPKISAQGSSPFGRFSNNFSSDLNKKGNVSNPSKFKQINNQFSGTIHENDEYPNNNDPNQKTSMILNRYGTENINQPIQSNDATVTDENAFDEYLLTNKEHLEQENYLWDPRFDWKYITSLGQLQRNVLSMSDTTLEQGEYIQYIQFETGDAVKDLVKWIEKIKFHLYLNATNNIVYVEKMTNKMSDVFIEKVWSDCALRYGTPSNVEEHREQQLYQVFVEEAGTYCQLFINNHYDKRWNFKMSFVLKNMEIYKTSNSRKPINVNIDPGSIKVLIIQQIGGKEYELQGGEGACFIEDIKDTSELERIKIDIFNTIGYKPEKKDISRNDISKFPKSALNLSQADAKSETFDNIIGYANGEYQDDYRELFNYIDKDGDNAINREELKDLMILLGQSPTQVEINDMMNEMDIDQNGTVNRCEFLEYMEKRMTTTNNAEQNEIREAFKVFDKNNTGFISSSVQKYILLSSDDKMSNDDFDELIKLADFNGDGLIKVDNFLQILSMQEQIYNEEN